MGAGDYCCVIGAGRIGLPISVTLATKGQRVLLLEKDEGRRLGGLAFGSAPSAPGYLNGALRPTFHTAMKSWKEQD